MGVCPPDGLFINLGDVSRMLGRQAFKDVWAYNRQYYGYERLEERLVPLLFNIYNFAQRLSLYFSNVYGYRDSVVTIHILRLY